MLTRKKILGLFALLFITLTTITCSDESNSVMTLGESLSNSDIIGTWFLTEIRYDSSGNNIIVTPGDGVYSHTLKFWENKQGQIISFNSGGAKVQNIHWNIQGKVIILISDDNNSAEYLHCEFVDPCLCFEYAYTTFAGDQVLAVYAFTKDE